ncbi:MAG: response regulator [Terriglobales bacterium]
MHPADPDQGAVGSAGAFPAAASGRQLGPTILLVEDEAFVRSVTCEILSSAGYRVLSACNAAEALQSFRSHSDEVHLLLTDVVLPDRNGCDLALELVTLSRGIRAVFVSGYPENAVTRTGLRQPGWFYLPKPFSAASLLQKIREVLNEAGRESVHGGMVGSEPRGITPPTRETNAGIGPVERSLTPIREPSSGETVPPR